MTVPDALRPDFDACEAVIRHHSKSFYAAFSRLPEHRNRAVYAVYAFCRRADDIVDERSDTERLDRLRTELDRFTAGDTPDGFMWRALRWAFDTYALDPAPFYTQLEGQATDLNFTQPENEAALRRYCDRVAGCVGLMLLPILTDTPAAARDDALTLGYAMQLTNILRDVGEDARRGRIYLPKDRLAHYGVDPRTLTGGPPDPAFIALWEATARTAEAAYADALALVPKLRPDCREPLVLALVFYRAILTAVRRAGHTCLDHRHFVPRATRARLYLTEVRPLLRAAQSDL